MKLTQRPPMLLALAVFGFYLGLPLAAQTTLADPNDALYADIDAWATKGLLKNLPRLRPYTQSMAVGLLKEVAAKGGDADAAEAQRYLEILEDSHIHPRFDVRADALASSSGSESNYLLAGAPGLSVNALLGDRLGISLRGAVWLTRGQTSSVTPQGTNYDRDFLYGSGSSLGKNIEVTQDLVTDASYGDENLGAQAGFMRGSWGPIYDDGVVIGPQSPESGQFTFSWRSPSLTLDVGFLMLQQGWSTSSGITDSKGDPVGFNSGKYLMIHGLNWAPASWLELGLVESIVWVDRIEPLYFIPLSEYFYSQSFSGYADNAFMGFSASVYLPRAMKLDLVTYVDDADFAGVLKGNWDTKWKLAAQTCLSWAPESPVVQRVSLDYTAVGPYTYTHWQTTGADASGNSYNGALAYTNGGQNVGPALDPNSDRFTLQAKSRTIDGFQASGIARLIRHGNASAGVNGYNALTSASGDANGDLGDSGTMGTNGSYTYIFQPPYDSGTWPAYFRFLTQSILQLNAQAGFNLSYSKPIENLGILQLGFGYLFECVFNQNCVATAPIFNNYFSFSAGIQL